MTKEYCWCGKTLHYTDKKLEKVMKFMVAELGINMEVTDALTNKTYIVPRHYIALHGINQAQLPLFPLKSENKSIKAFIRPKKKSNIKHLPSTKNKTKSIKKKALKLIKKKGRK